MEHRYHEYAFTIEGMTEADAAGLMNLILDYVEKHNYEMGGGYRLTSDADYPWFLHCLERLTNWLVKTWKGAHRD